MGFLALALGPALPVLVGIPGVNQQVETIFPLLATPVTLHFK